MPATSHWWNDLYDDLFAELLLTRASDAETAATARFLEDALGLAPASRVLDQCCGIGTFSLPLARRGHEILGVDQAEGYVARARAAAAGLQARFVAADAFSFAPERPVDGAFNWGTSFGYALDDAENARMPARAFEALRPGGRYALDVMNLPGVLRGLQKHTVDRRTTPDGELLLHRETDIDLAGGRMLKRWTFLLPDGRRLVRDTAVRLYLPHTIGEILAGVGFEDLRFFGGIDGSPLTPDSPRLIIVAKKPT